MIATIDSSRAMTGPSLVMTTEGTKGEPAVAVAVVADGVVAKVTPLALPDQQSRDAALNKVAVRNKAAARSRGAAETTAAVIVRAEVASAVVLLNSNRSSKVVALAENVVA